MNPTQLELRDIHEPTGIGWWPPAPGWWLLALSVLLLTVLLFLLYRKLTRKTAVKTAKRLLTQIKRDSDLDNYQKLCELSVLLRRVAVSISPRKNVAGLTGEKWLGLLDSTVTGEPFTTGIGRLLADAPYRRAVLSDQELNDLFTVCENWLKVQKT